MRTTPLLFVLSFATLVGCGEKDSIDDTQSDDTEADADTDADSDTDSDADTDVEEMAAMSGSVVDAGGDPVEGARVNLCKEVCRTVMTDSTGAFDFPNFEADWVHAFDVVDPSGTYMTPLSLVRAEADENRTGVTVTMLTPDVTVTVPTGAAATLDLCGVKITMSVDDLKLPFGTDGEAGACAVVPEAAWMPWDELPGTALAVWYLAPFDAVSEDGLEFSISNAHLGLADGTYHAWAAEYAHTEWSDAGTLTVSGDTISTDGKLHVLSTLIIVQE